MSMIDTWYTVPGNDGCHYQAQDKMIFKPRVHKTKKKIPQFFFGGGSQTEGGKEEGGGSKIG